MENRRVLRHSLLGYLVELRPFGDEAGQCPRKSELSCSAQCKHGTGCGCFIARFGATKHARAQLRVRVDLLGWSPVDVSPGHHLDPHPSLPQGLSPG